MGTIKGFTCLNIAYIVKLAYRMSTTPSRRKALLHPMKAR